MNYTVLSYEEWSEPRRSPYSKSDFLCIHKFTDEYTTTDKNTAKELVKELIDAPLAELTLEQVKKDFCYMDDTSLSEAKLISIMNYYNGRLGLYNRIIFDLENLQSTQTLRYDIPKEYNEFYLNDNIVRKHIKTYIEVRIDNEQ